MDTTIAKGLKLLNRMAQADAPVGVTAMAKEMGLEKSNVHRTLTTLLALGYVQKDVATSRYEPTLKLWELGMKVVTRHPVVRAARPFMQMLHQQTQETVHLTILDGSDNIYSDAVADLAYELDKLSNGKVIARLEGMYDKILVDEVQDLAGYDLEFLQLLLASRLQVVIVGDPRQAVYLTNRSNKNRQYRGAKLVDWIEARVKNGSCVKVDLMVNHRCNQLICDFADSIYPSMPTTTSANFEQDPHMGVVLVHQDDVPAYIQTYSPQELRWDRRAPLPGPTARNFGQVKGQSFPRTLLHPTTTITDFIEKGRDLKDVTAAKFYVAVTRARYSVAIVTKTRSTKSTLPLWDGPD